MDGNGATVAERLRQGNQRTLELEPGLSVTIQAVSVASLMADGAMPPTSNLTEITVNRTSPEFGRMFLGMIRLGVIRPRIWTDARKECDYAQDYVRVEDLARHHMRLFNEIWDLSGWSVVEADAAAFRGEAEAGGNGTEARTADGSDAVGSVADAGG